MGVRSSPPPPDDFLTAYLADRALIGETCDPAMCSVAHAPAAGTLLCASITFRKGQVITGLGLNASAAGVGVTGGQLALYDRNFALVKNTAAMAASFNAGGEITGALSGGAYTAPYSGMYYVGILQVGGTPATLPGPAAAVTTLGLSARNGGKRRAFQQTGLAALPNPAVPAATLSFAYAWAY